MVSYFVDPELIFFVFFKIFCLLILGVGHIPASTTQATLLSVFSPYGAIESVRILTHKNCGFVNFEQEEDAVRAKKALQNKEIMGPATGPARIGFAKVPTKPTNGEDTLMDDTHRGWSQAADYNNMMYMMMPNSGNLFAAVAAERQMIMHELASHSESATLESDEPVFDGRTNFSKKKNSGGSRTLLCYVSMYGRAASTVDLLW